MKDYQKRLIAERDELSERAMKLEKFIMENPEYDKLSKEGQKLACQQLGAMEMYCHILNRRIKMEGV